MYKTYINDISSDLKQSKKYKTIKTAKFKKKIKIFKKKNTMYINPNLKLAFKHCSVKEWFILSKKLEKIIKTDDYKINSAKIVSSIILSFVTPSYQYLLSSYYNYSSKRIPKISCKFKDIEFLIKSLILNDDKDEEHLKSIKHKLNRIGISNFKFVFDKNINNLDSNEKLNKEDISNTTKDIFKYYLKINKGKRDFKIFKTRKDFIYDGYLLFFLNLSKYELSDILFYKKNVNYIDYDYEVFVIKEKTSPE